MLRQASLLAARSLPAMRLTVPGFIESTIPVHCSQQVTAIRRINTPNDGVDRQGAYEGTGKTTVSILNQDLIGTNLIDSYSNSGFRLNDNTFCIGPTIVFPNAVLKWRVMRASDITMESLSLFTLLEPKLDLIVIGHGAEPHVRDPVSIPVILAIKKKGISVECLPTEKAISTYNYLMEEGRVVAAALIPPLYMTAYADHDVTETQNARGELLKLETSPLWHGRMAKKKFMRQEREGVREAYKMIEDLKKKGHK